MHAVLCATLLLCPLAAQAERHSEAGVVLDGVPASDPVADERWKQFSAGRAARLLGWLGDGSLLIATRFAEAEQVHRVRQPLGAREQLGFDRNGVLSASVPRLTANAFAWQQAGPSPAGANGHALLLQPMDGGAARVLAPAASLPGPAVFSTDGRRVAYTDRHRDGVHDDLYVQDADAIAGNGRLLAAGTDGEWRAMGWSRDDRQVLVWQRDAQHGDALLLVDVASGARQPLTLQKPPSAEELRAATRAAGRTASHPAPPQPVPLLRLDAPMLAADGRGVYFLERGSERVRLRYSSFDGSEQREACEISGHDVLLYDLSADGRYLACTYARNGVSQLQLLDQTSKLELRLPALPQGSIDALHFDREGARLALQLSTATQPADIFVFAPGSSSLERWTRSEPGAVSPAALVAPERARFPSWERVNGEPRQLDALVFRPRGDGLHGALVLLPGEESATLRYDPLVQFAASELGLMVVQPALHDGREMALRDLGFLLAWLSLQPGVDRQHLIVAGTGTAAGEALAALSLYGDRLQGAIAGDGTATPSETSAVTRPVLLLRGFSAPALPAGDAEQLLWRLRNGGAKVWFASAEAAASTDGAGNGNSGRGTNEGEAARLRLAFLRELLRETPAESPARQLLPAAPGEPASAGR